MPASPSVAPLPPLLHVGMVVADVAAAGADLAQRHGLEELRVQDLSVEDAVVRGEPQSFSARYSFFGLGNTEIELIEPLDGISPYSLFLEEEGEGIHHLAFVVDSIDERLAAMRDAPGYDLELDASVPRFGRFVYVTGGASGARIELVELLPGADPTAPPPLA